DPFGGAGSYAATINWGDGSVSAGVVTPDGAGGFLVTGSNTYGAPGSYPVSVQVSHNLGYTTSATPATTATGTPLGPPAESSPTPGSAFWQNTPGQSLINSLNGGPNSTALANWVALTFPNLYGAGAGANNMTGWTNAQVGAFYLSQFVPGGPKLE